MAIAKKRTTRKKTGKQTSAVDAQALAYLGEESFDSENNLSYTESCMSIYAKQTIENRAIPDYRDGLIPVQRRILYAMFRQNKHELVKSARVVGDVLGKWHPHGDTACYGAMVTLVQAPLKLIRGSGNWGSYDDPKSFAAMRYTECELSDLARKIFFTGYLPRAYDLLPNFDSTEVEPAVLHSNFPVALSLGKLSGIAVGVTCNTPSFTMESVGKLTRLALEGKKITTKMCMDTLEFNFSWGGILSDKHYTDGSLKDLYTKGSASLTFRSDYELNEEEGTMIIKSVPPNANYMSCLEKTHNAGFGVSDLTTVGSKGLEIVIDLTGAKTSKRTSSGYTFDKAVVEKLVKIWTGSTIPARVAITDRQMTEEAKLEGASKMNISFEPTIGITDYIMRWAKYRLELEVTLAKLERDDLQSDIAKLDLIILARENFDLVKAALDSPTPIAWFIAALRKKKISISEDDGKFIFSRTLMQLSKTDVDATHKKIAELKARIKSCNARIKNPSPAAIEQLDIVLS